MAWGVFVVLVLISAFFSLAETALTTISRSKINSLREKKTKGAAILIALTRDPARMLTTILLMNNLSNIASSVLAAELIFQILEKNYSWSFALMTSVTTAIVTFILLLAGEIIPKNFAILRSEKVALAVAPIVYALGLLFSPIIFILSWIAKAVAWILRSPLPEKGSLVTADEIQALASLGETQGLLEKQEKDMIHSIVEFGDLIVKEIMTPRADMIAVEMKTPLDEVVQLITDKGHSRIPVYNGKLDNIIGILHAKDLLSQLDSKKKRRPAIDNLSTLVRPAHFVPEFKNVSELFQYMRVFKNHLAIAVDEYGTVSGLISLEDIVEEIVGDIRDEFEKDTHPDPDILETGEQMILVKGTISIDKINQLMGIHIPEDNHYDSLGGFVFSLFGSIPSSGDSINFENLVLKVEKVRDRRILTVRIIKNS